MFSNILLWLGIKYSNIREYFCLFMCWFSSFNIFLKGFSRKWELSCCNKSCCSDPLIPSLHLCLFFLMFNFFKDFIYSFLGGEGRERNSNMSEKYWSVSSHMCLTQEWTHNPDMCPDQELNPWPFTLRGDTQPTEPHESWHLSASFPRLPWGWVLTTSPGQTPASQSQTLGCLSWASTPHATASGVFLKQKSPCVTLLLKILNRI